MGLWILNHIKQMLLVIGLSFLTCAAFLEGGLQIMVLLFAIGAGIAGLYIFANDDPQRVTATMEPIAVALDKGASPIEAETEQEQMEV